MPALHVVAHQAGARKLLAEPIDVVAGALEDVHGVLAELALLGDLGDADPEIGHALHVALATVVDGMSLGVAHVLIIEIVLASPAPARRLVVFRRSTARP